MVRQARREPDEMVKMIIGSLFTIAGGLCLYLAALTQGDGKIGLFWPLMFHLFNTIGFSHILPVSLALFSKIAPRAINATSSGSIIWRFSPRTRSSAISAGFIRRLPTTTFWLIHVASAFVGLVAFVLFKVLVNDRMVAAHAAQPAAA